MVALMVKNMLAKAGDIRNVDLIPESGRSPGEVLGNPLQYFCLENFTDRGAWWAMVRRVAESDTTEVTEYAHMSRSLSLRTPYPICLHPFPT